MCPPGEGAEKAVVFFPEKTHKPMVSVCTQYMGFGFIDARNTHKTGISCHALGRAQDPPLRCADFWHI